MRPPGAEQSTSPARAAALAEWRRERLLHAGLPAPLAGAVAADDRYDLHALLVLTDRGCDPELAVRILAPLDEDPR